MYSPDMYTAEIEYRSNRATGPRPRHAAAAS